MLLDAIIGLFGSNFWLYLVAILMTIIAVWISFTTLSIGLPLTRVHLFAWFVAIGFWAVILLKDIFNFFQQNNEYIFVVGGIILLLLLFLPPREPTQPKPTKKY
jgi:hypothetical protein